MGKELESDDTTPRGIIHMIEGSMESEYRSIVLPFTGYFMERPPGRINGRLSDIYGDATISGELTEGTLRFNKQYLNGPSRKAHIDYTYHAVGSGIWQGSYFYNDRGSEMEGNSSCITYPPTKKPKRQPFSEE